MSYNMGDSVKIFNCYFVLVFILICFPVSRCTNNSTICYGVSGLSCTTHRLSCPSPLVIQIINTTYGYRPGCDNINGLSECSNITCCNEEPGDCFISFSSDKHQQVLRNCSGLETCTVSRFREVFGRECGGTASAFNKIQYDCVTKGSNITRSTFIQTTTIAPTDITTTAPTTPKVPEDNTSTEKYSTDLTTSTDSTIQSDNSGVVGGVLGTLLIISVIINVGLVVYFTRKMKSLSSTPRENNYDGITNTGRDQTLPTYDVLQVQSIASSDNDDKKKLDRSHTYYNTNGDSLSRDIDPYYENMKSPGP